MKYVLLRFFDECRRKKDVRISQMGMLAHVSGDPRDMTSRFQDNDIDDIDNVFRATSMKSGIATVLTPGGLLLASDLVNAVLDRIIYCGLVSFLSGWYGAFPVRTGWV